MTDPLQKEKALADHIVERVDAHKWHGGWYESAEGLRCKKDDELVIPRPEWIDDSDN